MEDYKNLEFAPEVAGLPLHSESELEELKASIKKNGFLCEYPVIVHDKKIYDGRNRYLAALAVGVRPVIANVGSKRYALELAESSYLQRVFTADQKVQVKAHFANLKAGDNQHTIKKGSSELNHQPISIKQIAEQSDVSESKAKKAVALNNSVKAERIDSEIEMRVLRGKDKSSAAYNAISILTKSAEATIKDGDQDAISRITMQLSQDAAKIANDKNIGIVRAANMLLNQKTSVNGHTVGNNDSEWYTPVEITDKAHRVMGGIDVDPASNEFSQSRIQAGTYYTIETNGLDKEWKGNVWLNPPYGKSSDEQAGCSDFISKLLDECEDGNVNEYLVLVNSSNGTDWYERMCENCTMMGLSRKRIQFDRHPSALIDKKDQNTKGQTLFYFGDNVGEFIHEYIDLFNIMQPLNLHTKIAQLTAID